MSTKEQEVMETAVDFSDAESLEAELAAVEAAGATGVAKEKKPAKPRVIKVSHVATQDYKTGDVIEFDFEVPKSEGGRGAVSGIPLAEMTDDQLKIEYRNANSVFYKTKKANKNPEGIAKSEARLEAVKAEMEKRGIQPTSRGAAVVDAQGVAELIMSGKISVEEIQALLTASAATK